MKKRRRTMELPVQSGVLVGERTVVGVMPAEAVRPTVMYLTVPNQDGGLTESAHLRSASGNASVDSAVRRAYCRLVSQSVEMGADA
jgi:hypothetical protein